ncbi:hypothetical protein [Flavobacterium sp. KMS]|uniref:hypothetical protein n=1 Tax=Flavobacterium sp. KMS TaxID=1566023 RepID=UPI000AFD8A4F|nr:hypothetical protein [Flavobacterium sp. KMS]
MIENKYESIVPGYNGNFVVEINDKKLLINSIGEILAELKYDGRAIAIEEK